MGTLNDFSKVMDLVFRGKIHMPIDSTFPLSEVRAAHEKMERGDIFGKILLTI
jgi:NADPH:quinone reductase-like Zn-dependent oxidoreductase